MGGRSCTRSSASCPGRTSSRRQYTRSEEHTSELQSPCNLVCRLLLEKKTRAAIQIAEHCVEQLGPVDCGCARQLERGLGGNAQVFFFNDTATTEIYTLSLHDALPI